MDVRRIYDKPAEGHRVLVDRLWPRGIGKDGAPIDEWAKDVAPSTELRRWYGHDPGRFDDFARRYRAELRQPPASHALERLVAAARRRRLTLVTATRDVEHSGAHVLRRAVLERRAKGAPTRAARARSSDSS